MAENLIYYSREEGKDSTQLQDRRSVIFQPEELISRLLFSK